MQKKVPYVAQLGNMDCSIACMTMLFRYYGLDVDIVDVGQVVHIGRDGVNLTQLKQATQQFGFKCTAYRYNKQKNIYAFSSLRYPVIIQITSYSVSYLLPQKVFLIILKIFFREKETTLILAVCLEENLR